MSRIKSLASWLIQSEWPRCFLVCIVSIVVVFIYRRFIIDHGIVREKIITFLSAFIAFCLAFTQYVISQKWKKTEFLAQEYKAFVSDKYVQRAMYLLDFPFSNFQLFDEEVIDDKFKNEYFISYPNNKIIVSCNFEIVARALSEEYDDETLAEFNSVMNIIRYTFDKFSFRLGLFEKHVSSGLIKIRDLKPYLQYWMNTIINPETYRLENNQAAYKQMKIELIRYLYKYDYISLHSLLQKFGSDINKLFLTHIDAKKFYRIKTADRNHYFEQGQNLTGDNSTGWKIVPPCTGNPLFKIQSAEKGVDGLCNIRHVKNRLYRIKVKDKGYLKIKGGNASFVSWPYFSNVKCTIEQVSTKKKSSSSFIE